MDGFVARKNVEKLSRQLAEARGPDERERLALLLAEAEEQLRRSAAAHAEKPYSEPHFQTPSAGKDEAARDEAAKHRRINRLVEQLQLEPDQAQRRSLRQSLIEEEDAFGILSRQMDLADAHLEDGALRVAALELMFADLGPGDEARTRQLSNLANSREILAIFASYRVALADRAGRIDI